MSTEWTNRPHNKHRLPMNYKTSKTFRRTMTSPHSSDFYEKVWRQWERCFPGSHGHKVHTILLLENGRLSTKRRSTDLSSRSSVLWLETGTLCCCSFSLTICPFRDLLELSRGHRKFHKGKHRRRWFRVITRWTGYTQYVLFSVFPARLSVKGPGKTPFR